MIALTQRLTYGERLVADVKMKVLGRKPTLLSPGESLREAMILIRQAEQLSPYPRPRGFVHKARTYEDYARWRRSQPKRNGREMNPARPEEASARAYFNLARQSFTASKFGKSFGVAVCSEYCTVPCLSITNAARAEVSPTPASMGKRTP